MIAEIVRLALIALLSVVGVVCLAVFALGLYLLVAIWRNQ